MGARSEIADVIEERFLEHTGSLVSREWSTTRLAGPCVIFTYAEEKLQAEIGVRKGDRKLFFKVYNIPAFTEPTQMDKSVDVDVDPKSVAEAIDSESLALKGAINTAR